MEKYEEWNKKQEKLFNLFFDIKNEDTINFKTLVESVVILDYETAPSVRTGLFYCTIQISHFQ